MNNTIKCSYNLCKNESKGYYVGGNFGLWLCKEHEMGKLKIKIEDAKKDKSKEWMYNMEVKK